MRLFSLPPRKLALMAVLAATTACDRQAVPDGEHAPRLAADQPSKADTSTRVTAITGIGACGASDSAPGRPRWVTANQDSLRAVLDTLDQQIATATEADLPALLLRRGRVRTAFAPNRGSRHVSYAKAHPADFRYNEIGANWRYTGGDFRALSQRFPTSDLTDDAAYALTHLGRGGECEGYISCYVERQWTPVSQFLGAHPDSPLADSAITRALGAFGLLDSVPDLRAQTDYYQPDQVRKLVASLDTIGHRLQGARRARVLDRVGQLWGRFGDYAQARAVYAEAIDASPEARACIAPRLSLLPTRSFTLEPARIIHTRRVELRWQSPAPSPTEFAIYRSTARDETGIELARLPATALLWTDTTTAPATTYWYRVIAESATDTVRSNPAAADIPEARLRIHGIAVSTTDQWLHVFGTLWNGFPQVVRIAPDGASSERLDGMFIGIEENDSPINSHGIQIDDLWLADRSGQGVLRFRTGSNVFARDLLSATRRGFELLLLDRKQRGHPVLLALDEGARAIWATYGGGAPAIAMDCLAGGGTCWTGGDYGLVRLDAGGRTVTKATVPGAPGYSGRVTAAYADPKDGSVWALVGGGGRLLHVDTLGAVRHDIHLVDPKSAYSVTTSPDLDRRAIWLTRRNPQGGTELARIDVDAAVLQPTVVATDVPSLAQLAPDLNGGVWLVSRADVRRIDATGRTLFTRLLDPE